MKNKTTMKPKILSVAIIGLLFASCSSTHIISDEHPQRDQPTEIEQIEVYSDQKTERDYIIIGKLVSSVDDFSDANGAVKQLK